MSEEKVQLIASESEDIQTERAALRQKLEDLKASKRVLDMQACDTRSGTSLLYSVIPSYANAVVSSTRPFSRKSRRHEL